MTLIDKLVFGVFMTAMIMTFLMFTYAVLFAVGVSFWAFIW